MKFSYYIKNKKFNNQLNTIKKDTSISIFHKKYLLKKLYLNYKIFNSYYNIYEFKNQVLFVNK